MTSEQKSAIVGSGTRLRKPVGWKLWTLCSPDVLPLGFKPDLEWEDGCSYEFTPGLHLADLPLLHRELREKVWSNRVDQTKTGVQEYVTYVRGIWSEFELTMDFVEPGCVVHGDCTMENLLWQPEHGLRIIDPGHPRGLLCRELDEAKLLQSFCTHWEVWRRGWPLTEYPESYFRGLDRRVHLQLLLSHWLRLNRHHPSSYAEFVIHECKRLLNLHRSRWDPYRFSLQCASFLLRGDSEGHG